MQYKIHCNQDNSYSSFNAVAVSNGGFTECFKFCDNSTSCAGFTFVGNDGGSCYLKEQMAGYVATTGSNYITGAKLSKNAGDEGTHHQSPIGVIVGAAVGGTVAIILILVVIACIAKRRRRKVEEKRQRTTLTRTVWGPREGGRDDLFAPYGGR